MVLPWSLSTLTRNVVRGSSSAVGPTSTSHLEDEESEIHEMPHVQQCDLTMQMPEECLANIFRKMRTEDRNRCSLVCKHWHWVEAKARDRLILKAQADLLPHVPALMLRFEHVTYLSLKCNRKVPSIEDEGLVLIGKLCKQLIRMKIKGCKAITDDGLEEFSKVCGPLKKFSCVSCGFGAQGLNAILRHCKALEDLAVKRLRRLLDSPEAIVAGKCKLLRLSLKDLFHAQLFGALLTSSRHLHTLILSRNPGHWDPLFEIVMDHLPKLTEIHLESLRLGDRGLQAISRCSELEVFYLIKSSDSSDDGLCAIANGCRKLKKLHLDDRKSNGIGDRGLLSVASKCTELQELVLIGVNVTTTSLGLIASNCVGLERMALCNSEAVGDAELSCIAEKCLSLKKLCIKNCPISDHGLELFASGCPNLSKVKVKKCTNVTFTSASWLQMNRASLIISLDSSSPGAEEDERGEINIEEDERVIRTPTTVWCSRSPLLKNKLVLAAESFLRRFSKPS